MWFVKWDCIQSSRTCSRIWQWQSLDLAVRYISKHSIPIALLWNWPTLSIVLNIQPDLWSGGIYSFFKDICSGCRRPQPLHSMQASLCPKLKCLLEQGQAKLKWSILDKLVAAWIRVLLTFLISYVVWVLANSMNVSSCCFRKCYRNSRCGFSYCIFIYTHFL